AIGVAVENGDVKALDVEVARVPHKPERGELVTGAAGQVHLAGVALPLLGRGVVESSETTSAAPRRASSNARTPSADPLSRRRFRPVRTIKRDRRERAGRVVAERLEAH